MSLQSDSPTADTTLLASLESPAAPARLVLDRLAILGIVDTEHLTDLTRYAREDAVKQLEQAGYLVPLDTDGHLRVGRTGRSPLTYALTTMGARLVRSLGHERPHPYEQGNRDNQAHDICTLDIRFAALRAGCAVETERSLVNAPNIVRPDNAVRLTNGAIGLFETEGFADAAQRPRLLQKALRWQTSASALQEAGADLRVRVLFNLKAERAWDATCDLWADVLADAQTTLPQPFTLQFWGRRLHDFLSNPQWDDLTGWTRLDDPARLKTFSVAPAAATAAPTVDPLNLLPEAWLRQVTASADEVLLLRAHARYFTLHLLPQIPPYSRTFFDLVREIHNAARANTPPLAIPVIALWMMRTYLGHYPDLHRALTRAVRRFSRLNSVLMAQRAATQVIRTFLKFHGVRHDSTACQVWVLPPDLNGERDSDFSVQVRLDLRAIFDDLPRAQWPVDASDALAWVLQQLLDYPAELGLLE